LAPFAAVQTARVAHSWPVALSGGMRKGRAARWNSGKVGSANRRTGVECCDHLIDLASPDSTSLRTLRAAKCSAGLVMELAILDEFLRWLTSLVIRPSTSAIFELTRINAPLVCRSIWVGSSYRRTAGVRLWGPRGSQPLSHSCWTRMVASAGKQPVDLGPRASEACSSFAGKFSGHR
jgi:hypothetical protein